MTYIVFRDNITSFSGGSCFHGNCDAYQSHLILNFTDELHTIIIIIIIIIIYSRFVYKDIIANQVKIVQ